MLSCSVVFFLFFGIFPKSHGDNHIHQNCKPTICFLFFLLCFFLILIRCGLCVTRLNDVRAQQDSYKRGQAKKKQKKQTIEQAIFV